MHRIVNKGFERKSVCIGLPKQSIAPDSLSTEASPASELRNERCQCVVKTLSMVEHHRRGRKKVYPRQETFGDSPQSSTDSPFDSSSCKICSSKLNTDHSFQSIARCGHKTGICDDCWKQPENSFRCCVCMGLYCRAKCTTENPACGHTTCPRCSFQCKICSDRSCVTCLVRCTECCVPFCRRCVMDCYRCGKPVCATCRIKHHGTASAKFLCEVCLTDIPKVGGGKWLKLAATKVRKALYACENAIAFTEEGAFAGHIELNVQPEAQ